MTDTNIDLTEGPFGNNFTVGLSNTGKKIAAKVGRKLTRDGSEANIHYTSEERRIEIAQTIKREYAIYLAQTRQKATSANLRTFMKKLMNTDISGLLKDYRLVSEPRNTPLSPEVMQKLEQFGTKLSPEDRKEQDEDFARIMNVLNVSYESELAPKTVLALTQNLLKQASGKQVNRERLRVFLDGILSQPEWASLTADVKPVASKLQKPEKKLFASFREGVVEFAASLVEEQCRTGSQVNDLYKIIFEDVFLDAKTLNDIIMDVVSGDADERQKAQQPTQSAPKPAQPAAAASKPAPRPPRPAAPQAAQQQASVGSGTAAPQKASAPAQQPPRRAGIVPNAALDMGRLKQSLVDHDLPDIADEIVQSLEIAERTHRDKDKEVIRLANDHRLDPENVLAAVVAALK